MTNNLSTVTSTSIPILHGLSAMVRNILKNSSWRTQVLQRPAQTALRGWLRSNGTCAKTAKGPEKLSRGLQYSPCTRPTTRSGTDQLHLLLVLQSCALTSLTNVLVWIPSPFAREGKGAAACRYNLLTACGHKTQGKKTSKPLGRHCQGPTFLESFLAACGVLSIFPPTLHQGPH